MSLNMKYFVLKPGAKSKTDPFALASQLAMFTYADMIEKHDKELAVSLRKWAGNEAIAQTKIREKDGE